MVESERDHGMAILSRDGGMEGTGFFGVEAGMGNGHMAHGIGYDNFLFGTRPNRGMDLQQDGKQ